MTDEPNISQNELGLFFWGILLDGGSSVIINRLEICIEDLH